MHDVWPIISWVSLMLFEKVGMVVTIQDAIRLQVITGASGTARANGVGPPPAHLAHFGCLQRRLL